ncbi:MAG TPA: hypothetical protein PKH07_03835, partial [bacterium]|nr:hypothetical protein [bacterium]
EPRAFDSLEMRWLDPLERAASAEYDLSKRYFGGESFPFVDTHIGPGSLATMLGSKPGFHWNTVWYNPCIADLENHPPLAFDPDSEWFKKHVAILEESVCRSRGRYLVSMPDLIENIDTLASLRGSEQLMMDLIEQPEIVHRRLAEINQVYFQVFDALYERIKTPWGGNVFSAFCIWGPGKTAKVQCDAAAMISPDMFGEFVVPYLTEQCQWLDYALFHLDGVQCICHLDQLLAVAPLKAIQWTPQAGVPPVGDSRWFDLYKRILDGGKSVQILGIQPERVEPVLKAIGTKGVFMSVFLHTEFEARSICELVERYRSVERA